MDNEEDIKRKQELIKEHKGRLHFLEKRATIEGITVDPSVTMQIEDIKAIIMLLESEIEELEQASQKARLPEDISGDIIDVLGAATVSQKAALVLLAQKIEQRLIAMFHPNLSQENKHRYVSPIRIVEKAIQNGVFQQDFWKVFVTSGIHGIEQYTVFRGILRSRCASFI